MRLEEVTIFFDICVFINIVALALKGLISTELVLIINNISTILLVIELAMKIVSNKLCIRITQLILYSLIPE